MLNLELLIIAKYLTVLCSELKPESVFFRGQRDLGVGLSWKPVDSSVNWFMAVVIFVNCGFCFLVTNNTYAAHEERHNYINDSGYQRTCSHCTINLEKFVGPLNW